MTQLHHIQRPPAAVASYSSPASWAEALELLAAAVAAHEREQLVVIAGCTDVATEIARGAHPDGLTLVDLSRLASHASSPTASSTASGSPRFGGVELVGDQRWAENSAASEAERQLVLLNPLTTHADVACDERAPTNWLPLAQACAEVGSPPLRNRATVVGNVVTASPANDSLTPLYALGADVTLDSVRGARTLPIDEFVTGYRTTALAPDELVREISFGALGIQPDGTTKRGLFAKLGLRAAAAISVVHVAAVVTEHPDGSVAHLAVALGSVGPTVVLVSDAAAIAAGRRLADVTDEVAAAALDAASPLDDVRATAQYRRATVQTLTRRVLTALAEHREAESFGDAATLRLATNGARPTSATAAEEKPTGTVTVDGVARPAATDGNKSLLNWLRDDCDVPSPKEGCAEGECGACVVRLDGAAVFSCLAPAPSAAGADVVTLTGSLLNNTKFGAAADAVAAALVATNGTQCGFCTPGFVMSAATLLTANPTPTRTQVTEALSGNICRCTGYYSIVEAVETAATQLAMNQ